MTETTKTMEKNTNSTKTIRVIKNNVKILKSDKIYKNISFTLGETISFTLLFFSGSPQTAHELYLCREATEEAKPEVHHGEGKVLVEEIAEETTHSQVGPAAVHEQEAL